MNTRKPGNPSEKMQTDPNGEKPHSGLNREIQSKIGQQLRAMYDDVVQEGVPDRFADLLRRIDNPSDEGKAE
jgi:hypothetical protein